MWNDLRRALRAIRQSPALSLAAIVCLALGIGANITVFDVATGLLDRNIPGTSEPDRLVAIHRTFRGSCCTENSYPIYEDLRRSATAFQSVEAHYPLLSATVNDGAEPERIWGQVVSPEYFDVLGTRVAAGRTFSAGESGVVVISYSFWQRRYAGDASAVGRQLSLNKGLFTIVGIAPASFRGPDLAIGADVWVPMASIDNVMPERPRLQDRAVPWLLVYARLRPGVSIASAQSELNVLARQLESDHPNTDTERGFVVEAASAFHPTYRGTVRNVAAILAALVGLVLIVACANVANMLLARASARRKEIAIRVALGAGAGHIIRGMIVESTTITLLGGAAGIALSRLALTILVSVRLPISLPLEWRVQTDWRTFAFATLLSVATGTLLGIFAGLRASRPQLVPALKGAASASGRAGGWQMRDVLSVVQVSSAVVLLVVTLLFVRSLGRASSVNPGFRTDRLLLVDVDPRMSGAAPAVMERLRSEMEALPGVESATYTDVVPLGMSARAGNIRSASGPANAAHPVRADIFQVGPRFLKTLNIPLLRGRDFLAAGEGPEPSAIINTTAAAQLWPGEDAVGRTLYRDGSAYRVIGLVPAMKTRTVGEAERPLLYLPMLGRGRTDPLPFGVTLAILTTGDPARMSAAVRDAIHKVEPSLAVSNVRTMGQHIDTALIFPRAGALVFGCFGAIAILLTSVGLYGIMSHNVARRTREFGIRFALGARKSDVVGGVLARGSMIAATGVFTGLVVALCGTRVFRTYLYGVAPTDPLTFAVVPLIVTGVCLLACYVPARHAAAVDPLVALKAD